jgi:hypothetical protein
MVCRSPYGFVAGKRLGKELLSNSVKRLLHDMERAAATKTGWGVAFIASSQASHELGASEAGLLSRARILADRDGAKGRRG